MREPMTDADLDTLIGHAEYGHFEGQDYDAVETLVAEVRRLRAEVAGADENVASWQGIAADLREERDHYRDGIATQRDAALSETVDCYDCCAGCPMEPEDYPDWLTATWSLIGDGDA